MWKSVRFVEISIFFYNLNWNAIVILLRKCVKKSTRLQNTDIVIIHVNKLLDMVWQFVSHSKWEFERWQRVPIEKKTFIREELYEQIDWMYLLIYYEPIQNQNPIAAVRRNGDFVVDWMQIIIYLMRKDQFLELRSVLRESEENQSIT